MEDIKETEGRQKRVRRETEGRQKRQEGDKGSQM